ncbi:MAG: NAD(P)H-binding protein [Chitinophagaceae bacterium]|nr:NAD(P)H-binding protein [Chitinophagaceae bacterium]
MKFTVTGSLGNISKPLTQLLIDKGHEVTVVSSDSQKAGKIEALGANPAIGSVEDVDFLARSFEGADGIYTMVPPNWNTSRYRQYIGGIGKVYLKAIQLSGIKKVVNLSSIGAHLPAGTGSIAGLHDVEDILNTLDGVAIRHLRAGLFFPNFFFDMVTIRNMGLMGNNYGSGSTLVMVHPRDIAGTACRELESLFTEKKHLYVVGEEGRIGSIVRVLGSAIGKPDLPWVQFSDEETLNGMIAGGMSKGIAEMYVEMGRAIGSGVLFEDFEAHKPRDFGPTKLSDFVSEFAAVYHSGK